MEVKSIELNQLGHFERLNLELAPTQQVHSNVTVLIGNNGSGKTSILKSLSTSLSWFVARLRTDKGRGNDIPTEAISTQAISAAIHIHLLHDQQSFQWTQAKTVKGRVLKRQTDLNGLTQLTHHFRTQLTENADTSLPLIAFYPVERSVLDIPLKIRGKHSFLQLDGYDNSLNQGVDFRRFFEWFREREDSENENGLPQDKLDDLLASTEEGSEIWKKLKELMASGKDRQLTAVRNAIANFMPGFNHLRVQRKPRLHMAINKHGQTLNVSQLSQGEKSLIALVGDIARRLAMMNPARTNPLEGDGIVLIDEVDMHLHPTWQRSIIKRLTHTFPNCQFILTTHSPLVISDCQNILVYGIKDGVISPVMSQYGQDANTILLDVMDTPIRNTDITQRLNDLWDLIQQQQLTQAQTMLSTLESDLPANHLELHKAKLLLQKAKLHHEKT